VIGDLLVGVGAGALAGLVFFGGLRWTLDRLVDVRRPELMAMASFFVRLALMAAIFIVMAQGRTTRMLAGLVGLVAVRTVMVWSTRRGLRATGD